MNVMGKLTILKQRLQERYLYEWAYRSMPSRQQRYIAKLSKRKEIRVAFFVLNVSMWKYQGLAYLLRENPRFRVCIVLSPGYSCTQSQQLQDIRQMRTYFAERGMEYIDWRLEDGEPAKDVRQLFDPDIVFYSHPYHGSYHPLHCFLQFTDRLIAYTPYSYLQSQAPFNYDNVMQNIAWKLYYANRYQMADARRLARNKGVNVVVAGYPSSDVYLYGPSELAWKDTEHRRKRLIWAPHFTLANDGSVFSRSNFLMMADFMVELAERYRNELEIAFKPHPNLLSQLQKHPDWGYERTEAYYKKWQTMENTQLADGEFVNLFRDSDAMIHDSGSFVVDYLYFNHPVMFVTRDIERAKSYVNEPGKRAYDAHYVGKTLDDVQNFVDQVVLGGNDTKQTDRQQFFSSFLEEADGLTVAQHIYDDMVRSLGV